MPSIPTRQPVPVPPFDWLRRAGSGEWVGLKHLTISMYESSVGVFTGVNLAKKDVLEVPAQIREK